MRVTFLGTGTSHGIPMIGCSCAVCNSTDPRNLRLRPSILVETPQLKLLVDATPDFRQQALRHNIHHLDAVLLTHTHADHIFGLDDLRAFTERDSRKMPIYASAESLARIQQIFPYACEEKPRWPGLPSFELHAIASHKEFEVAGLTLRALPVPHGRMTVFGFLIGRELAYLTDCNEISPEVVKAVQGVTVFVVDALRHRPHPTHLTVAQALEVAGRVRAKLTFLTHMCHDVDHAATEATLPAGVRLAYDGLVIEVNNGEVASVD
jgi:phosphoribosyl 1,2-cyclic phosphate phosphodiesterase